MVQHSEASPQVGDALVIVDLQRDFLPGGALGVANGDAVVGAMNDYLGRFVANRLAVFATRDWHPANHCSFVAQGGPWPPHCIAGSPGAGFADGLRLPADAKVISKATTADRDAYSGFDGTDLQSLLRQAQIKRLYVGGLATDYCVKFSTADALKKGLKVKVLIDAVKGVDLAPGDSDKAIKTMVKNGAKLVTLKNVKM